jgi:hypothetical protein
MTAMTAFFEIGALAVSAIGAALSFFLKRHGI